MSEQQSNEHFFPETGLTVRRPFLDFVNEHGLDLCGYPLTEPREEDGVLVQYFQNLALAEVRPGMVRPKPICAELLNAREQLRRLQGDVPLPPDEPYRSIPPAPFPITNLVGKLPVHPTDRYPSRALSEISHLVIHHTAAPPELGPEAIARYHVEHHGWPGIGYHFVIDAEGTVYQTNGLITSSFHARQFNATSVGIALMGNLLHRAPPEPQLNAAAQLCAWLLQALDLPVEAIQGHRELVSTQCPGNHWLQGTAWKYDLQARVSNILGVSPPQPPERGQGPAEGETAEARARTRALEKAQMADGPWPTEQAAPAGGERSQSSAPSQGGEHKPETPSSGGEEAAAEPPDDTPPEPPEGTSPTQGTP